MATAATPGSTALPPEPALVPRFGATERTLHWVHAAGFTGMLASGLVLYLPALSAAIGDRPTVKAVHLGVAAAWLTALALVATAGDRRALRRTRREIEHYVDDDVEWLRGRRAPQGRFNAGQKTHAVVQSALAALFILSGVLLWLGERVTAFRLPGSVALHDGAMFVAIVLVLGHLFLAVVWPATRPALRGIVRGSVRADWARRHHAAWTPSSPDARVALGPRRRLHTALVLLAGGALTAVIVAGTLGGGDPTQPAPVAPTASALAPGADVLAIEARRASAGGRLPEAVALLRRAVVRAPRRGDLRAALGLALAETGDLAGADSALRVAVGLSPKAPDAHLVLGAVRLRAGRRAAGRSELRSYLRLAPQGANAALARRLLREP